LITKHHRRLLSLIGAFIFSPRFLIVLCVTILTEFFPVPAMASEHDSPRIEQEHYNAGWEIFIDNDAFSLLPLDQDYTGGLAVVLYGKRAIKWRMSLNPIRQKLDDWIGFSRRYSDVDHHLLHSVGIGFTSFTPKDTSLTTSIYNDRPYSSLVFVSHIQQIIIPQQRRTYQSALMVGALGLGVAEYLQNTIHSSLGQGTANGWGNQISNGGELTAKYSLLRQTTRAYRRKKDYTSYEFKTTAEVGAGYVTDIAVGFAGRIGKIRTPWWSFNPHQSDFVRMGVPVARTGSKPHEGELYLWGGLNARYVFYNAMLQGQFRDSAVTFSRSELNPVIFEAWGGLTKRFASGRKVSLIVHVRTPELKVGDKRNPMWVGLIIGRNI